MMYSELSNRQRAYIDAIGSESPALGIDIEKTTFSRAELRQVSMATKGKKWIPNWITHDQSRRVARGAGRKLSDSSVWSMKWSICSADSTLAIALTG